MKQTIPLLLVASASTSFFAATLTLREARAQAPGSGASAPPAAPAYPVAAPAGAPSAPAAVRPPYPPAQPVGQSAPTSPTAPAHGSMGSSRPSAVPSASAPPSSPPASAAAAAPPSAAPTKSPASPATASPAASAGTAGSPALAGPTPPEELAAFFKGADGTWRCDGKMPAGVGGPGSAEIPYKSTVKLKRDLGGFWIAGEYEIKKSKTTPGAQARFFIGFEPRTKQFISASFDSLGGMDRGGAPGLQGNALALTGSGTVNGMKVQTRSTLTFTKPGKELDYRFELDRGQGFQVVGEDSCKKLGAAPLAGAPGAGGPAAEAVPGGKVAAPAGATHAGPSGAGAAPHAGTEPSKPGP